jgi:hypothetical protein
MRIVQLMKKMSDASKIIFRVYQIRIIAPKKMVHTTIFCDLLLKSAFERIFNVMQLILVKIKSHIK